MDLGFAQRVAEKAKTKRDRAREECRQRQDYRNVLVANDAAWNAWPTIWNEIAPGGGGGSSPASERRGG